MPEQKKAKKVNSGSQEEVPEAKSKKADDAAAKKREEDLSKIIDEIDETLEENAEEFMKSYVQRGGQ